MQNASIHTYLKRIYVRGLSENGCGRSQQMDKTNVQKNRVKEEHTYTHPTAYLASALKQYLCENTIHISLHLYIVRSSVCKCG